MLTAAERRRLDEAPDAEFYSTPRLMTHASPAALEELRRTDAPPVLYNHSQRPHNIEGSRVGGDG